MENGFISLLARQTRENMQIEGKYMVVCLADLLYGRVKLVGWTVSGVDAVATNSSYKFMNMSIIVTKQISFHA